MISRTTKRFRKLLADLPLPAQRQARVAYMTWLRDPWHPALEFKQIHAVRPIFSARISLNWRTVGIRSDERVLWYFIGSHADYEKLIKML